MATEKNKVLPNSCLRTLQMCFALNHMNGAQYSKVQKVFKCSLLQPKVVIFTGNV